MRQAFRGYRRKSFLHVYLHQRQLSHRRRKHFRIRIESQDQLSYPRRSVLLRLLAFFVTQKKDPYNRLSQQLLQLLLWHNLLRDSMCHQQLHNPLRFVHRYVICCGQHQIIFVHSQIFQNYQILRLHFALISQQLHQLQSCQPKRSWLSLFRQPWHPLLHPAMSRLFVLY